MAARHLIIAGFHRSGTSMTAQALHRAGLPLGEALLPPHPSNPDGHFEDADIVEAHDDLLGDVGQSWHYDAPELPPVHPSRLENLRRLAADRDARHAVWGFKDPRVCLFLDTWQEVLDNPVAVVVFRSFRASLTSLLNRGAWSIAMHPPAAGEVRLWSDPGHALRMWVQHNDALVSFARTHPDRTLVICQRRLLEGYPLVAAVNESFGLDLDSGAPTGVRPGAQSRADADLTHVDPELLDRAESTWHDLCALAGEDPTADDEDGTAPPAGSVEALLAELPTTAQAEPPAAIRGASSVGPVQVAQRALNEDRPGDALALLAPVLGRADAPVGAWLLAGRSDQRLRRNKAAERSFRHAAQLDPTRPAPRVEQARCLLLDGRVGQAAAMLRTVEETFPEAPGAPLLHCEALQRLGRHEEAVTVARTALARLPAAWQVRVALARALHRAGHAAEAAEAAATGEREMPGHLVLDELSAALLNQAGRRDEAAAAARRAAASALADPTYVPRVRIALSRVPEGPARRDLEARVAPHLSAMVEDRRVSLAPGSTRG